MENTDDLFGGATEIKKVAKTSSKEKEVFEVKSKEIALAMKDYLDAKKAADEANAKFAMAEGKIKPYCREKWLQFTKEEGHIPDNFAIRSEEGNELLFIVQKKYKAVKDDRIPAMIETFGEELFQVDEEFVVNPIMIAKYGKQVSSAIMNCADIPDEDKRQIIQKRRKHSIVSDALDKMIQFAEKGKMSLSNFFDEISPTLQLKARGK